MEEHIIGIDYQNIPSYGTTAHSTNLQNFISLSNGNSIFTGLKWECVEFVRRWYIINNQVTFESINRAIDLVTISFVTSIYDQTRIHFHFKRNYKLLYIGDILVFDVSEQHKYGHIAIVTRLDGQFVYISEQNNNHKWDNINYSRKFTFDELFHHKNILGFKTMYA